MTANNTFTNNSAITGAGSLTIADASGNSSNTGSISQATVEISGNKFTNNGGASITTTDSFTNSATDLANNGLITSNGTFTNNSGAEITGNGSLVIGNGGTNAGNITQDSVSVTGDLNHSGSIVTDTINIAQGSSIQANGGTAGSLTLGTGTTTLNSSNAGSITVGEFTNNANSTLNGSGSLSVTSGSNAGTISQDSLTVAQGASGDTFTNSSNINTNSVTNSGSLSNSGTIDTNTVSNSGAFTNSGSIGSEGNAVDTFTNSGTFTNEGAGSLIATTIENRKDATFTNNTNNVQAGTFNNDGTVEGAGSLELGSGTNTGSITQDAITIATGGSLTSQGDGTNSAIIEVNTLANGGSVTLDNSILNVLTGDVTTGTINAINSGNELNADLSGGNLNIGYNGTAGSLKQTGGSVTANTIVDIAAGSTYDINTGSITIDNGDNWEGKITLTGGSLTTVGFTEEHGVLDADTGSLSITNSSEIIVGKDSSIAGDVATTIDNTSTLNINNGGSVVLNSGDDWAGTIVLGTAGDEDDTSSLDISGLTQNGTLQANSGTLGVGTGDLNISTGSYIENAVRIETEGNINITGTGIVGVDDNDTLSNSSVITLTEQGILNYGNTTDPNFKIEANSGNLNLLGGSKLTIDGSSSIADAVALDIQQNSQLTLDAATLNLDNADRWDGKIINEEGTINANGLINDSQTASLEQTGGVLNVYNDAQVTLGENSFIQDGEINIYTGDDGENGSTFTLTNGSITGGDMTIDENSAFIVKNGTFALDKISGNGVVDQDGVMHAALVNVANGERVQHNITELAINGQTNFNIDIHARGNHYTSNDQFVVSSMTGNGTARIDNWSLNGDIFGWDAPIDRHITLDHIFVDENGNPLQGNIEITRKTEFTPIGYYQLNQKGSGTGLHYTLDLVDFNPQVFRGQVATVAQWMNQLAIDDMLFTHSMVLPSFKEEDGGVAYSGVMANRYASSNPLFAPYQYSRKDGGLWYKMYGTFENLNMNVSGLGRVGNNAYGALIGADFGLKELKNGWKFMPTAYIGYNGAHQAYPGVGAFQNGGQAGFLGTWYKNNFIVGGLVYGGVYENSMDVGGHTDNAFNYFAGAATKLAYNWRFHRDWVLQPNLMAAYNFFGQQNWHSDYGQMGMMSGMLNGVNLAPGVNLIWEKETFSIYGTLQYMYNLNGAVGGRAGNVGLPQVEMERGYIQYGLGFTKRWGDRFSGYLQAVLRNVGRTGVGFQLGFNILLGK